MTPLLVQEELPNADQDARSRDAMYERAESLGSALSRMGDQLRTAIHSVNDAAYASQVSAAAAAGSLWSSVGSALTSSACSFSEHLPSVRCSWDAVLCSLLPDACCGCRERRPRRWTRWCASSTASCRR